MNKLIIFFMVALCSSGYAQTRTVPIQVNAKLHAIEIYAPITVEIQKGTPAVYATIDPEFASKIKYDYNSSGVLTVSQIKNTRIANTNGSAKLTIYTEKLDEIEAASASRIEVMPVFEVESLEVDMSSSARLTGAFKVAGDVEIECSSAARGELVLQAEKVTVSCSSSSRFELSGKCQTLNVETSSASQVNAKELKAMQVKASSSSASKISVQAEQKFWLEASSASKISYYGNGTVVSSDSSSGASISRK